jgi:hypothetical protein
MRVHGRGGGALARRQPQPGMQRTSVTEPTANTSNDVVIQRVLRAVAAEQTPAWEALIGDSALVEIERVRAAWRRDPGCAPACAAPGLSSAPVAAGAPPPPSAPSLGAAPVAATTSTPPPTSQQRPSSAGAVIGVRCRASPLAASPLPRRAHASPGPAHTPLAPPLCSLALSLSRSSYRPAPGNAASCLSPTPGPRGAERDIASAHRRGGNPVGAHGGGASNAAEAALARHSARRPLRLSSHRARAFPLLPRGRHDGRR